jgi:hypothetical protein
VLPRSAKSLWAFSSVTAFVVHDYHAKDNSQNHFHDLQPSAYTDHLQPSAYTDLEQVLDMGICTLHFSTGHFHKPLENL